MCSISKQSTLRPYRKLVHCWLKSSFFNLFFISQHGSHIFNMMQYDACGLLTEIIVFECVYFCFCFVVVFCVFLFGFVLFYYESTRQPYWQLVDFWLKLSCVPSVNNPHCGHIESLWIADWNHRVFLFLFCCCCFLSVNTAAILKACRFLTEIIMCSISQNSTRRPYWKLVDIWLKSSSVP